MHRCNVNKGRGKGAGVSGKHLLILINIYCRARPGSQLKSDPIKLDRKTLYYPDGITETMTLSTHQTRFSLRTHLQTHLATFEVATPPTTHGFIQLLYSLILSRGIEAVRRDMDDANQCQFIEEDSGFCTQEMLNLIVTGRAVSNVHDGDIILQGNADDAKNRNASQDTTVLHGITGEVCIGLLSVHEYRGSVQVGQILKNPRYPIYILGDDDHFSVLFCLMDQQRHASNAAVMECMYYDPLSRESSELVFRVLVGSKRDTQVESLNTSAGMGHPSTIHIVDLIKQCMSTRWHILDIERLLQ